jgi:hypothetical protein
VGAIRNVAAALISDGQDDYLAELFGVPARREAEGDLVADILAGIKERRA